MPTTVFTLCETNDETGYVLAVFTDRDRAIAASLHNARVRAEHLDDHDREMWGEANDLGTYRAIVQHNGSGAEVFVVHTPSGERDDFAWNVQPFEIVEAAAEPEPQQIDLFQPAA